MGKLAKIRNKKTRFTMRKKAQVTFLIVIAIVVLILSAFLIYYRSESSRVDIVTPQTSTQELDKPVIMFVESCLESSLKDAINLVGMQGGRIYNYQAQGTAAFLGPPNRDYAIGVLPYEYDGAVQNVSYGIYEIHTQAPDHPYEGSLKSDKKVISGENALPALCDNQGANAWNLPELQYSCIDYDLSASRHSIQEYMQKYIEQEIVKCADFSNIDIGTKVETKQVDATVLFGENDVRASVDFEIEITDGKQTKIKVEKFTKTVKVRFKKIYELAYYLIEEDNSNLFFSILNQDNLDGLSKCPDADKKYYNEKCLKPDMSVELVRSPCRSNSLCDESQYSNLVIIQDNASKINNKPYVFMFAVKNRPPVLDYIDESVNATSIYYFYLTSIYSQTPMQIYRRAITSHGLHEHNIVSEEDVIVYPFALDPDEEIPQIKYKGWKTGHAISVHGHNHGGGSQNRWQQSSQYQDNHRDAAITTSQGDNGFHFFRVIAEDEAGLQDYQDVEVFIRDRPAAPLSPDPDPDEEEEDEEEEGGGITGGSTLCDRATNPDC
ncbi:MAG: hypothetical protein MAG795_00878 [Candidatus Woesearchaeota archaeon]|nr:hypothetical protein [Candidatus Woesearchaeota archaeon]